MFRSVFFKSKNPNPIRIPKKRAFTGLKTPQNCLFSSHLFFRQSWTEVLGHFCISGAFSNSHRSNPSPHPTNNVGRVYPEFFSEFQLCIGWGGGRTARKFRKRYTVLRGNRKIAEKYEYYTTVPRTFVKDCSNEIRAGAGREKQYGRITFPPKKKRIYCYRLEYYSPITMPL